MIGARSWFQSCRQEVNAMTSHIMHHVTKDRVIDTMDSILVFLALAALVSILGITFFAVA
jgi:hypothetical protein